MVVIDTVKLDLIKLFANTKTHAMILSILFPVVLKNDQGSSVDAMKICCIPESINNLAPSMLSLILLQPN